MFSKLVYSFLIFLSIVVFGLGLRFYWQNLRGIKPVVFPAPYDISKKMEANTASSSGEAWENHTEFPLRLPDNFEMSVFAKDLSKPRAMAFDPQGNLIVSLPSMGKIVALPDKNGDGAADEMSVVAEKLNNPHGLAFRFDNGGKTKLYAAENDKVTVFDYDQKTFKASMPISILKLPPGGTHTTRSLLFAPASVKTDMASSSDGDVLGTSTEENISPEDNQEKLLVSIGSSCNVCVEKDPLRASVQLADIDGTNLETYASGLRNAVFMALHPVTGQIWATEMGRDMLGDELPPDEVNILKFGSDYGWPYCYGKNMKDSSQSLADRCASKAGSYIDVPAHSAPLGLAFFPHEGWPEEYWDDLLVAYHGSWNRTKPVGYKIVRYRLDLIGRPEFPNENGQAMAEDFVSGWLLNNQKEALGRPVDIKILPNGTIFITDDKAGLIYRMKYEK